MEYDCALLRACHDHTTSKWPTSTKYGHYFAHFLADLRGRHPLAPGAGLTCRTWYKSLSQNRATVAGRHWRTSRQWHPDGVSGAGSKRESNAIGHRGQCSEVSTYIVSAATYSACGPSSVCKRRVARPRRTSARASPIGRPGHRSSQKNSPTGLTSRKT